MSIDPKQPIPLYYQLKTLLLEVSPEGARPPRLLPRLGVRRTQLSVERRVRRRSRTSCCEGCSSAVRRQQRPPRRCARPHLHRRRPARSGSPGPRRGRRSASSAERSCIGVRFREARSAAPGADRGLTRRARDRRPATGSAGTSAANGSSSPAPDEDRGAPVVRRARQVAPVLGPAQSLLSRGVAGWSGSAQLRLPRSGTAVVVAGQTFINRAIAHSDCPSLTDARCRTRPRKPLSIHDTDTGNCR
jgi:hypothetical protein